MTKSIYFLCSGNACRSQIAEGYAKQYLPNWDVQSAGVRVDGLNPWAVKTMAEDGVDISQQYSKLIDQDFLDQATVVVTLCGEARDKCIIPQSTRWLHWPINDPALATGNDEEIAAAFRDSREDIKQRIIQLAAYVKKQSK
ncbi:arsenate reductase (thioredoxin) [Companilactobacillus pabuli]|jgi:arsenate reductase|uniref:Arsenate reductase (Thioredoxin) n=1 Tax=Companilactobacillus pabuli TaxID=2714036 RepID=A0A7L7KWM8_9LACO|nr:arsenate reductase (thioredoxin) [Companilactobacillus pabuli]AKP03104.1 arsenate reductase [Companilactobacillus farciminis]AKS51404.1 arsenate reductase [Companilactobacillus farciminis]QMT83168.1 arsenate reductase (thioredoxin) [Companilactobacillus pabuli]GAQ01813.1 arsenate reductase [Companilactobacillus farciminis]